VIVSVTGLRLHSRRHLPRFLWHAVRAMRQAQAAPGNLRAEARTVDGVHHTLTVWEDGRAMGAYVRSGPHRAASAIFHDIATGRLLTYRADGEPTWEEAVARWHAEARDLPDPRRPASTPG
jgi:hypothetical protein